MPKCRHSFMHDTDRKDLSESYIYSLEPKSTPNCSITCIMVEKFFGGNKGH